MITTQKAVSAFLLIVCFIFLTGCSASRSDVYGTLGQRILVIVPDTDIEDMQFTIAQTRLTLAGNNLTYASPSGGTALTGKKRQLSGCLNISSVAPEQYDSLLIINSIKSREFISDPDFIRICTYFAHRDKPIAASGYAVAALAPFMNGMHASAFPNVKRILEQANVAYSNQVVTIDRNFITGFAGSDENDSLFIHSYIRMLSGKKHPIAESVPDIPFTVYDNNSRFVLTHAGKTRSGVLTVPENANGSPLKSLIFALHWTASTGEQFKTYGFDELAPELDFIMVYPDGYNGDWEIMPKRESNLDETGLFETLITELTERYPIDTQRIYATGFSLGAFAVYKLACEFTDRIAAIAPVSGLMYPSRERPISNSGNLPKTDMSLLHIHCLDDRNVPYTGDPVYGIPVAAEQSVLYVRNAAGAAPQGKPYPAPAGAAATVWSNPGSGAQIVLTTYPKGGHAWQTGTAAYISDFFYNHPPRENRIMLDKTTLPYFETAGTPLDLSVQAENPDSVTEIVYIANGEVIGTSADAPFGISWIPPQKGKYTLSARATLTSGTRIASTLNHEIYITDSNLAERIHPAVSATSAETDFLAAGNAFDSNPHTRWASEYTDNQNITADFGRPVTFSGMTILWEAAYATAYEVQVSRDGKNWRTVYTQQNGTGADETLTFSPVTGRYIRIACSQRASRWGYSVWEIIVRGEPA